ncbi:hypothetical protein HJC23_008378 [Cyclotella cryptica]|uniref:carbonic anhydrase n=1 Tax=Cyclotella cryptica TaxID=29204 RepID=A0ABD3PJ15_9STRA|eukprot:CCRYP_014034-RA/>CCRYP_014034-RA protein AED:0.01 eAED:0.01 QI:198/1/1/1/1/1/3/1371/514
MTHPPSKHQHSRRRAGCRALLATTTFLIQFQQCNSRSWLDVLDPTSVNDGMPQHANKDNHWIEIHGIHTPLFQELDPSFDFTAEPSAIPSTSPSSSPSFAQPSKSPTRRPTRVPTPLPTFATAEEPLNPPKGYFNYDPNSNYGPSKWGRVNVENDFWHTFDINDKRDGNDCGSGNGQSPIDVCVQPRESCKETHEMRPKSGDYKMDGPFITKQILPNKLRLIMAPRTGDEPDPPQVDYSSNGKGLLDMTNIDFKFPSEHTVCGKRFDGEMQYYTYNPGRRRFVAVSFFLEALPSNPRNEHLQEVINALGNVFNQDKLKCQQKQTQTTQNDASTFAQNGNRDLHFQVNDDGTTNNYTTTESTVDYYFHNLSDQEQRRLALKWHPFHPDIQKTVHFWGYKGSFTEPPCTSNIVDWKIMDVPTPISMKQLSQFKQILFNHVDENCKKTGVQNSKASVARPTQEPLKYYKCTRDNYVSDEERHVCGDQGCKVPFGEGLNPYYDPIVDVTGPPTRAPST